MKHIANIADLENYSTDIILFSSAGRGENKRLVCRIHPMNKTMEFVVINHMDDYEKEYNSLENAIDDYNEQ